MGMASGLDKLTAEIIASGGEVGIFNCDRWMESGHRSKKFTD
jgi:hypothetical protein